MRRLSIILVVLALLLGPLAPVQSGWACANGTACVADGTRGFRCADDRCGTESCCVSKRVRRCHHGAVPGAGGKTTAGCGIQGADDCRYTRHDRPVLSALRDGFGLHLVALDPAPPIPAVSILPARIVACALRVADTCGYRPPPLLPTGPSRAPPLA